MVLNVRASPCAISTRKTVLSAFFNLDMVRYLSYNQPVCFIYAAASRVASDRGSRNFHEIAIS